MRIAKSALIQRMASSEVGQGEPKPFADIWGLHSDHYEGRKRWVGDPGNRTCVFSGPWGRGWRRLVMWMLENVELLVPRFHRAVEAGVVW